MQFKQFKALMQQQATSNLQNPFQLVANVDPYELYNTYLEAFPTPESKQDHTCNCCSNFIRHYGALVRFNNGKLETIWDNVIGTGEYEGVAEALAKHVRKATSIKTIFRTKEANMGTDTNVQRTEHGDINRNHFFLKTPAKCLISSYESKSIDSLVADLRVEAQLLQKSFDRLTLEGLDIAIDLIEKDTIYRGKEYLKRVQDLRNTMFNYQRDVIGLRDTLEVEAFTFNLALNTDISINRLIGSVMGTLLLDICDDTVSLDTAVYRWNNKLDPTRFNRPVAVFSARDTAKAIETIKGLGLEDALERRLASIADIDINDVLFVNNETTTILPSTGGLSLLEAMGQQTVVVPKNLIKTAKEVKLDDFTNDILKKASRVEVYFESSNQRSLVSLITETKPNSGQLFKWNNPFSWSYNGALADSAIKQKVKAAGGGTEGYLRISLGWENKDDLDLHLTRVDTVTKIYHGDKRVWGGHLDVDMNVSSAIEGAVENIIFPEGDRMAENVEYIVQVNNYTRRTANKNNYTVELEFDGITHVFKGKNPAKEQTFEPTIRFKKVNGKIVILNPEKCSEGEQSTTTIWGINTNQFHDVNLITLSPNFWKENTVGNKQIFFFINKAENEEVPRGFFTEFLRGDLEPHRRVFEALGDRTIVARSDNQLTGLGFSETLRNDAIVRVTVEGKQQLLKILF